MAEIRQRIARCQRGHYYDANRYGLCPLCNKGATPVAGPDSAVTTVLEPDSADVTTLLESDESVTTVLEEGSDVTTVLDEWEARASAPSAKDPILQGSQSAFKIWGANGSGAAGKRVAGAGVANESATLDRGMAAGNFSKTVFVGSTPSLGSTLPVVGWLVAIKGPLRGYDFRIHVAHNYIGREMGDICLRGDMAVSAERDSCITFVPKTRSFHISHEQGKNVLLVNDRPVIGGAVELSSFDVISIGNSDLVFVAFCGPRFGWDTGFQDKA